MKKIHFNTIFKKRKTRKIVSVFLILWLLFFGLSFAQQQWSSENMERLQTTFQFIVWFLSRWRVLLASIAGKLMTNDMVYWSFIHMDVFIRKARNIMKNFANYALWFGFLFFIIKSFFSKWWAWDVKWKIIWFIAWWVLVQASRFIFWAIIDVSTITLMSISSFPWQILQSNVQFQKQFNQLSAQWWNWLPATWEVFTWIEMVLNPNKKNDEDFFSIKEKPLAKWISQDNYMDMILPSYNNISWPLIFMWTSIFWFQNYTKANYKTTSARKLFLEFGINLFIILIYSIWLLFLIFINFIRIFYLWIFIIFSPFIILLAVAKQTKLFWEKASGEWILKQLSFWNAVTLIFKPVIFVAYISIMLIFVIWVKAILLPQEWWNVNISDNITISSQKVSTPQWDYYDSSIKSEDILDFSVNWAKNSLADLIVAFFTLFLMRFLIKMAVSKWSWIDRLDKNIQEQTKKLENMAWQLPVVPIAWWVWLNSVFWNDNSIKSWLNQKLNISDRRSNDSEDRVNELLWISLARKTSYTRDLENNIKSKDPTLFRNNSAEIATKVNWWLSITDTNRSPLVKNRREQYWNNDNNPITWTELIWNTKFEDFLNINASKINTLMWWKELVSNYNDLKKQRFWTETKE